MLSIICFLLLVSVSLIQESASRKCDAKDEVPCSNGDCISHREWCDSEYDCVDGSDEKYCSGKVPCLESHFACHNRKCIPSVAVCNGRDNCGDGSDEICEGGSTSNTTDYSPKSDQQAIVEAVTYLLKMRGSDYGWDKFTPRAVIALKFAEKLVPISEKEKTLMEKRLNVEILLNLMRNGEHQKLADLALYINALYAMCQDPRNFHGMDLVGFLRSETDIAMKSDFNLPIVLLTLCLAKETKPEDFRKLISMYDESNRIGSTALTVMAMVTCSRRASSHDMRRLEAKMADFARRSSILGSNIDVYSKALTLQAFYSLGYVMSPDIRRDFLTHQLADGSFGDLLATYSAIPALLNTSLLDLKCKELNYEEMPVGKMFSKDNFEKEVQYSVWIADSKDVVSHTMLLTVQGNKTFYDVMRLAEMRDPMYRFSYDETAVGKKIYSLGGFPSDAETGMLWTLYRGKSGVVISSKDNLREEIYGVDKIYPANGNHFVFWMDRSLD